VIFDKRSAHMAMTFVILASVAAYAQGTSGGPGTPSGGVGTLAQRIGHFDRTKTRQLVYTHDGAGTMEVERLLGNQALSTTFQFLDEAIIDPHGGLGEHFHDNCEEMFVALEGPDAQFTINGHTSVLQTPAGAPDRMGSAHAFYNPTDQPILWLDYGVGNWSKAHDGFNLGDDRVGAPLDKVPQFVNWHMDPKLLKPVNNMEGGTGTVMYRRLLGPAQFYTPWAYTDDVSIPAGASIGPANDPSMSEVYFVLSGTGTVTVNGETVSITQYDAIPVDVGQTHSFAQTGSQPLHLLVNGIAKDREAKRAFIDRPENAGGGASRPGFPPPGRPPGN
jgi:mannose-6-phosphate isomerase-like protein (cupin superfamily)